MYSPRARWSRLPTASYPYISPIFELAVISNESLVRQPKISGSGHGQRSRRIYHQKCGSTTLRTIPTNFTPSKHLCNAVAASVTATSASILGHMSCTRQQMGCALFASLALNVALLTLLGTATRPERTSEGCATKSPISNGSNAWQRLTSEGCATKSDTSNGENAWQRRCLDREPLLAGCDSYLLCAQTPPARAMVQSSFTDALYHRTIPRALMDSTEGPATRTLLVPIRKAILPGEPGTSELERGPAAWPARAQAKLVDWEAIPGGVEFRRCGAELSRGLKENYKTWSDKQHSYCKFFTDNNLGTHLDMSVRSNLSLGDAMVSGGGLAASYARVFERPEVRLVLDVGAGSGGFATSLYRTYGDRIITVSANVMADPGGIGPAPFHQLLAMRGFPTVALDADSFFPFGESTFDVLHASWVYHYGYSRTTLLEMYRVIRPGGYLILNTWDGNANPHGWGSSRIKSFARRMNWKLLHHAFKNPGKAAQTHLIYQMSNYRYIHSAAPISPKATGRTRGRAQSRHIATLVDSKS